MLVSYIQDETVQTLVVLMAKGSVITFTDLLLAAKDTIGAPGQSGQVATDFHFFSSRIESDSLLCDDKPEIYARREPNFIKQGNVKRLGSISNDTETRGRSAWSDLPKVFSQTIIDFVEKDTVVPLAATYWGMSNLVEFERTNRPHTLTRHFDFDNQSDKMTGVPFFNHLVIMIETKVKMQDVTPWYKVWTLRKTNSLLLPKHLWTFDYLDQNWLSMNYLLTKQYSSEGDLLLINPTYHCSDLMLSYWVQHLIDEAQLRYCRFISDRRRQGQSISQDRAFPKIWLQTHLRSQLKLINLIESFKKFLKGFVAWEGTTCTMTDIPYEICGQKVSTQYPGKFAHFKNPSDKFRMDLKNHLSNPTPGFSPLGEVTTIDVYERFFELCPISTYTMLGNLIEKMPLIKNWVEDRLTSAFDDFCINLGHVRTIRKWFNTQLISGNEEQIRIMSRPNCRRFEQKDWSLLLPRDFRQIVQLAQQLPMINIPATGNDAFFQSQLPVELFKHRLQQFVSPAMKNLKEGRVSHLRHLKDSSEFADLADEIAALPQTRGIARERGTKGFVSNPEISDEQLQIFFQEANERYNALKSERAENQTGAPVGWPCTYGYTSDRHFQADMQRVINFHNHSEDITFEEITALFRTNNINQEQLDGEVTFNSDMERDSDYSFAESEHESTPSRQDQHLKHTFFSYHLEPPKDLRTLSEKIDMIVNEGVKTDLGNVAYIVRIQEMIEKSNSLQSLPIRLANQIKHSPYFEWLSTIKKSRIRQIENFNFDVGNRYKNSAVFDLLVTRALNQFENRMPNFGHVQPVFSATMPAVCLNTNENLVARFGSPEQKIMIFEVLVDRPGMTMPLESTIMLALSYAENLEQEDFLPVPFQDGVGNPLLPFINAKGLDRPREQITRKIWDEYRANSYLNELLMNDLSDVTTFRTNLIIALSMLESKNILPIFITKNETDCMFFEAKTDWHRLLKTEREAIPPYILISPPTVSEEQVQTLNDAFSVSDNIALHSAQRLHNVRGIKQLATASAIAFPRFVSVFAHNGNQNQMSLVPSGMFLHSFFLGPWNTISHTHGRFDPKSTLHQKIEQILSTRPIPAPKLTPLPKELIQEFEIAPGDDKVDTERAWRVLESSHPLHFEALRLCKDMYINQNTNHSEKELYETLVQCLNDMCSYSPPSYQPYTYTEVLHSLPNLVIPTFSNSDYENLNSEQKIDKDHISFVDSWGCPYDQSKHVLFSQKCDSPLAFVIATAKSIMKDIETDGGSPVTFFPSPSRMLGYQPDVQETIIDIDWEMTNGLHAVNISNLTSWGLSAKFNFVLDTETLFPLLSCVSAIEDTEADILMFQPLPTWNSLFFLLNPLVDSNLVLTQWHKLSAEAFLEMGSYPMVHKSAKRLNEMIHTRTRWSMDAIRKMRIQGHETMTYNWNIFCPMLPSHTNPPFSYIPVETCHYTWLDHTISPREVFANISPLNTWGGDDDEDLHDDDFTQSSIFSNYSTVDALIIYHGKGNTNNPVLARIINPFSYFFRQVTPPNLRMVKEKTLDSRARMIKNTWRTPRDSQHWANSLYALNGTDLRQITNWCRQIDTIAMSDIVENPKLWHDLLHDKQPPTIVVDSDVWTRTNDDHFINPNL